ncbi:MAG TPA: sodium:solute symporter [Bacteroidales bacterium]|nr:sodium:solute symporter [Bacteroidales bacterium]
MATSQQILGTWILIIFYSILIIYFVVRGALKTKSLSDYAVGNVNFSPAFVGLSLAVSMTSAATFIVNPGLIAVSGFSGVLSFGIFFPLATIISLIVLTKSFRKYGQSLKAVTLAQWIGKRYESKYYALFMGFLSFLLITFIVLILVALTKVLAKALNANEIIVLAVIIVFVFGYMMFGGANSLVYTNTIQAFIMLAVAFILLFSGYDYFKGGIDSFFQKLAAIDPVLIKSTNPQSFLFRDYFEIIFAQIVVGAAVVCQPHIITKSLFLKEEKDVNKFLTTAVIAEIIFFSVVFVGLYARLTFPDLTANGEALKTDGIIPAFVVKIFSNGILSVIIGLIVILGLISAGLSTLEGLIQSLSTTITSDIIKPLFGKHIKTEKSYILINKLAIVFLAIISFIVSIDQLLHPKLSVAILAQNGVYAYFSVAFIPIVFGIFIKNVNIKAPVVASIVAFVTHFTIYYGLPYLVNNYGFHFGVFTKYLEGPVRNPAIASASAIIISSIIGVIMHQATKKK